MLPDRVSNPGPLTNESGALPIALRGPANKDFDHCVPIPSPLLVIEEDRPDSVTGCAGYGLVPWRKSL